MTVSEAIERGAVLYPADMYGEIVYSFLSEIESRINTELLGKGAVKFSASDGAVELAADNAHVQLYPIYIAAMQELAIGDADRYSFFNSVFEQLYSDYANSVNREKKPCDAVYIKTV